MYWVLLDLAVWTIAISVAAVLAGLLVAKTRSGSAQKEPTASEMLSKFREQHSRGELSDEEFRTIKTALAARLEQELKDNGETG
jgi:uncharacterized membrane protein